MGSWLVGCRPSPFVAAIPETDDPAVVSVQPAAEHPESSPGWTGATHPTGPEGIYAYTSPGSLPELRDGAGNPLPLRSTGVHAALRGHMAAVAVRQRFENASSVPIEVTYSFPLPENSAVMDMRMTIGNRIIASDIMRREDARNTYEAAKASGHTASLLEQERPNIFTQSVANIAPGEHIDVEIRYLQTLTYDSGEYEFVFPMVVGPRFSPPGSAPDAANVSPPVVGHGVRTGQDIAIELDIQAGFPIVAWSAPTHPIEAKPEGGNLGVALASADELPNRDFVFRYRVAGSQPQGAVFLGEPDPAGRGHYLMVVYPPDTDVDAEVGRREIVFVVDRSGSMRGPPLALAKQTVRELLARLRPVDTFDVVGFASGTERLFGTPRPANAGNLVLALQFLDDMRGGGGTMMANAVQASLADDVAKGFNRYVLFLTDGWIGNEDEIFAGARALVDRIGKRGNVARVFGIGIGSSPNTYFTEGLAKAGGGVERTISTREHPARAVNALMHDIDRPALTDLALDPGPNLGIDRHPAEMPDLFVSQPVVVMGRYDGTVGDTVTLSGKRRGQVVPIRLPVRRIEGANPLLSVLWARAKVGDLTTQLWHDHDPAVIEQITELGLEHRLVTAYTSLVAVDRTRVVSDGDPERVEQPGLVPEGTNPASSGARPYTGGTVAAATAESGGGNFKRMIRVQAAPVQQQTSTGRTVSMEEFRSIPIGSSTGRDFTQVVEASATASRDAAGISVAGTSAAESKYMVEGATMNNPSFGTVGTAVLQEFIETVELQSSGYEAEYGGVSGAQIHARRISGSNRVRGLARFTFTPRLANPRFIQSTDNAIRTVEIPDYAMEGTIVASGPIIKDRLFWSAGLSATRSRNSLVQSFHHRVDADGSGGFAGCPYQNGDFDCAEGSNAIATERFAEQRFRTGGLRFGYQLGLDWAINPRHRLGLTVLGAPRFHRRSYRGAAFDPFNPNLTADPLGGASVVGNGVVNDHLGWDRGDSLHTALNYSGRFSQDRIELDANLAYSRFVDETAWRLDNPSIRDTPATQRTDTEGINLFELLDRDGRLDAVPGVAQACASSSLPGLACPVRQWLSGGLGQYGSDRNHRAEGRVALTHYFFAAGSHQVKYGTEFEHLARRNVAAYSGRNASDFYDNCAQGGLGGQADDEGGEWCFDRAIGDYLITGGPRVDNHRYIIVDPDNPDLRTSYGFGRVRKEQGELGAIATPQGAGIRAPRYDETLTNQNYGLFLQDKWSLLSNLLVTAGVRWEMQDMRDILGRRALFIWDKVAPRLGVVYDWTDQGRSRLFASFGWFYNSLPIQLGSRVAGGLVDVRRTYRNTQCEGQHVTLAGETFARSAQGQPTEYCTDVAATTSQLTAGAVVPRLRGQYNQQFQVGYEHEVVEDLVLGVRWLHTDLRRAVEDVSTNGGLDFIVANPGVAVAPEDIQHQRAQCTELDAQVAALALDDPSRAPLARELSRCQFLVGAFEQVGQLFERPTRQYNALTFDVRRRFANNWMLLASYTYSRLRGNYDGFVDPITGAINLGSSVQYDTPELVRNSFGPLSFDSPHRLKLDGFYIFDLADAGRLVLGTSLRVSSGLPISLRGGHGRYPNAPVYILPRGTGGRIQPNVRWNMTISYGYPLPANLELEAGIRIINVTNARAVLRVDQTYSFQRTRPVAGGDLADLKHTKVTSASNPEEFFGRTVVARQGNYGVETSFQTPLSAAFELRLRF